MKNILNKLKGYRLHQKRIYFTSGEITRTVKIPIDEKNLNNNQKEYLSLIKNQIINDDLKTRGDINLNDYLNYTFKNNHVYNLIDFWLDSLKAGLIWQEKGNLLVDFINKNILKKDITYLILNDANNDFKNVFDLNNPNLKYFFTQNEVRVRSTKKSFEKKLISFLKKELVEIEKSENKENIVIKNNHVKKIIDEIVNNFFKDDKLILIGANKQNDFWKNRFNIDKTKFELYKPKGELKDITFMIVPELVKINEDISLEELLSLRINFFNLNDDQLKSLLGLENNFSAFSNYLGKIFNLLYEDKINEIFSALITINPQLNKNKELIFFSLNYLKDKAKFLGKQPEFKLINNWSDFRMMVGGKIQSWFTNYSKRKKELNKQTEELFSILDNIKNLLKNNNLRYKETPEISQKENLIIQIEKIEEFKNQNLSDKNVYEIFDFLLAEFKRDLNFFYQKYLSDEKENIPITEYPQFKEVYKKIYKPMSFFGEVKKINNEKNTQLIIPIIKIGINIIKNNLDKLALGFYPDKFIDNKTTIDSFLKNFLNFYFNKLKNKSFNSDIFKNFFIKKISLYTLDNFYEILKKKNLNSYTFIKSTYSTSTQKIIELKETDFINSYKDLVNESINFIKKFDNDQLLKNEQLLTDWVETAKNISSQLIKYSINDSYSLDIFSLTKNIYKKIDNYINLFKLESLSKFDLKKIWQSLFLSELKGAVTLYSKKTYLAKYLSQFIGSDRKINLYIFSSNQELVKNINLDIYNEEERKKLVNNIKYFIDLGLVKENKKFKNQDDICLIKIQKEKLEKIYLNKGDFEKLYRLTTTGYQFQFLDKLIYKPNDWKPIDINLSEWSLVLEKYYQVNWRLDEEILNLKPIENSKKNKLYLTIPIKLKSSPLVVNYKLIRENGINFPILGIDVGEYGLGYSLVEFKNNGIKVLNKGFIKDKNIAKIKDEYEKIQEKSKKGIFNEIDTTISRIRENAIGKLRNQVHKLVINHISTPIYESSISNFETGSGKTVKIYNSVKRADVYTSDNSDADNMIRKSIWGKDKIAVGKNVSAYGSSQTCIKCKRSLYEFEELKKEEFTKIKLIKREGNILTFSYNGILLNGFYEKKDNFNNIGENLKNESDFKAFKSALKKFSRPPLINSEVINKFAPHLNQNLEKLIKFKNNRGNSSIFICPFADCHFVADADIQASFIMAIRGYIKISSEQINKDKNKNEKIDYFNKTFEILKKFNFIDYQLFSASI